MKMKKILSAVLAAGVLAVGFAGCNSAKDANNSAAAAFDASNPIAVVTREEGSGTRDAFVEMTGVMVKDADGNKVDNTTAEASVIDGTQAVMSTVAGNEYAIGYISLGSLNDTVKSVKVNDVAATVENIKSGEYALQRPFNIAVKKSGLSEVAQDFVDYILSKEGQAVVEKEGYVKLDDAKPYSGSKPAGKISIGGSSSVGPLMEKLKEAYCELNTNVKIEIQVTDSTSGVTAAAEGTCDIGMASRDLKDDEPTKLDAIKIATDGIAVIVNNQNTNEGLSIDQIKNIYTGAATAWNSL